MSFLDRSILPTNFEHGDEPTYSHTPLQESPVEPLATKITSQNVPIFASNADKGLQPTPSSNTCNSHDHPTTLFPVHLIRADDESESEIKPSDLREPAIFNESVTDQTSDEEADEMRVGRWTHSIGASRKGAKSRTRKLQTNSKNTDVCELGLDSSSLYKESQRLIREADIQLPEHRPKQFKRFSEFRRSLHGGPDPNLVQDGQTEATPLPSVSPTTNEVVLADEPASPRCASTEIGDNPTAPPEPSTSLVMFARSFKSLLPSSLPPVRQLNSNDEFIDLGESLFHTTMTPMTPAERLMARFEQHTRKPAVRKKGGPVEYSIVTKVTDAISGNQQLKLESVAHQSVVSKPDDSSVSGRKYWKEHRRQLEEQMRRRRLEQYETRLKETDAQGPCVQNQKKENLSDEEDEEWSEGMDEDAGGSGDVSDDESSCTTSSSSESESEAGDDDEEAEADDDVIESTHRRRPCAFADDEAEESDRNGDSCAEDAQSSADEMGPSRSPVMQPHERSKFEHLLQLDDFTDLPTQPDPCTPAPVPQYTLGRNRLTQASLGPGDIDLFSYDQSTVLDRTVNSTVIAASTRLDLTALPDQQKSFNGTLSSSSHSQWNATPYDMLYSQKPISQMTHLSKDHSSAALTPTGSLDTIILSQASNLTSVQPSQTDIASDQDVNRLGSDIEPPSAPSNSDIQSTNPLEATQDSQRQHDRRFEMFGISTCMEGRQDDKSSTGQCSDSQVKHDYYGALFSTQADLPESSILPPREPSIGNDGLGTQDSQENHNNRFQLFGSSYCTVNRNIEPTQKVSEADSQQIHENRRQLFASSYPSISVEDEPNSSAEKSTTNETPSDSETQDNFETESNDPLIQPSELLDHCKKDNSVDKKEDSNELNNNSVRRHRVVLFEDEDSMQSPIKVTPSSPDKLDLKSRLASIRAELQKAVMDSSFSHHQSDDIAEEDDYETKSVEDEQSESPDKETDENDVADDDDEEEVLRKSVAQNPSSKPKLFRVNRFVDEEAELSGDENERAYYMDDDDELADDDQDLDDLELIAADNEQEVSAGRLRRQVERVHQRLQADQDQRELRFLKELYFEDGDLYAENGQVRQRRFRWRGLDTEDPTLNQADENGHGSGEDSGDDVDSVPFGPMDRWLKATFAGNNADPSDNMDTAQQPGSQAGSDDTVTDEALSDEDEKENFMNSTQSQSVLSLGRQAVLKAKGKQHSNIVVMSLTTKTTTSKKDAAPSLKNNPPTGSSTLSTCTSLFRSSSVQAFAASQQLGIDRKNAMIKRGSLLGRIPTVNRDGGGLNPVDLDDDSNSSQRSNSVHFFGLKNKVGMSCFNVVGSNPRSQPNPPTGEIKSIESIPLRSTGGQVNRKQSFSSVGSAKRPSTNDQSENLKRPRSASIFSALL